MPDITADWFLYEGADPLDCSAWQYYDCKLVKDIGEYPAGCKLQCITVNCETSVLEIYEMDNETGVPNARYHLSLQVGDRIVD